MRVIALYRKKLVYYTFSNSSLPFKIETGAKLYYERIANYRCFLLPNHYPILEFALRFLLKSYRLLLQHERLQFPVLGSGEDVKSGGMKVAWIVAGTLHGYKIFSDRTQSYITPTKGGLARVVSRPKETKTHYAVK